MEHPVLKEAKDALERLSADPESRVRAEQREMALISYELGLSMAHRQGRVAVLERLLTTKFGTLPAVITARLSSASDAELATWADRILTAGTLETVFEGS
jgi:hypothetical protein